MKKRVGDENGLALIMMMDSFGGTYETKTGRRSSRHGTRPTGVAGNSLVLD